MKSFLKLAANRKTVFEFSGKKVPDSSLNKIINAGILAPSYKNIQNWSFIVVKNRQKIRHLTRISSFGFFHSQPQILIAVVLEPFEKELYNGLFSKKLKEHTEEHNLMNISLPALQMSLEATDLGLGSCILSVIDDKVDAILKVPKPNKAMLLVGLGFEKKSAFARKKSRKPREKTVFFEKYGGK